MSEQQGKKMDGKVRKEINRIFSQTGRLPSLAPFLSDPETYEEAYEIWQDWMKTTEKMTARWRKSPSTTLQPPSTGMYQSSEITWKEMKE